jgi:chromosomal replication initiation ATPase DnaA
MDVEDEHLVLAVPDLYFRQWVQEHYGEMVDLLVRKHGLAGVRWLLAESSEQQRTADTGTRPSVR